MTINLALEDANRDGKGIDFNGYLKTFDKRYEASDYGGFINEEDSGLAVPNGGYVVHGDDYVSWDGYEKGQSVIFEGGSEGWSYAFDGADGDYGTSDDHTLSGDITAIIFGAGTRENASRPEYTNNGEIRIAFAEMEIPNYSKSWISDISDNDLKNNTASLLKFLNSDSIEFAGSSGRDKFTSFDRADVLHGEDGADKLNGGKGNDTIYGDAGNDTLTGAKGADTFVFEAGDGKDKITDFGNGADIMDFGGHFADLEAVTDAASDGKKGVTIAYGGGSVLLEGWKLSDLTESQFAFDVA